MPLESGPLHLQGPRVRVTVVATTIPAGNPKYPSQKTRSTTLTCTSTPALLIPSDFSTPSLANYDTLWPTHSPLIRGVEDAAMTHITNVAVASLMTPPSAWASHLSVGLMTG